MDLSSFFQLNLSSFLTAFVLLFAIFDAVGTVPVFLALTQELNEQPKTIIRQSVLIATIILLPFASVSVLIFQVFSIALDDFRIAGGIDLFIIAVDNLRVRLSQTRT